MNYYPHHIGDFRSGTVNMSRQSRWIYRDMMDVYYDTEKPLPDDLDVLCDMIGVETDEERRIVERLLRFKFTKTEDGYRHERCETEIAAYHHKAAQARANGRGGGRPRKQSGTNEKPSGFLSGSDPVPSSNQDETGSKANQEPRTKNQETEEHPPTPRKRGKSAAAPGLTVVDLQAKGVSPDVAAEFLAIRSRKRAPLTELALAGVQREADKAGLTLDAALRKCVERGWQGFDAGWVQNQARASPAAGTRQANDDWMSRLFDDRQPSTRDMGTFDATTGQPV
ncbi:YdaU family protein [Achromobacter denitrificans]|uniref:YdaU family protein n=1 Tax=Achromobacter denitrificans TaxID=32002 RepID=A0ABZ3G6H3_ACHDE